MISLSDTVGKTYLPWAPQIAFIQGTMKPVEHLSDCPTSSFLAVRDVPCGKGGDMLTASRTEQPLGCPSSRHIRAQGSTALMWGLRTHLELYQSTWTLCPHLCWDVSPRFGSGSCQLQGMFKAPGSLHLSFLSAVSYIFTSSIPLAFLQ